MQAGWTYEADIWAIGCTIAELKTGKRLFPEQINENVHLMLMEKCLGKRMPPEVLQRAWQKSSFARNNHLLVPATQGKVTINGKISDILQQKKFKEGRILSDIVSDTALLDLLTQLLELNPTKRPKAGPLRRHSFFENSRFDRSNVDVKTAYQPLPSPSPEIAEPAAPSQEDNDARITAGMQMLSDFDGSHSTQEDMELQLQKNLDEQREKMAQLDLEMNGLRALQRQLSTKARKERARQSVQSGDDMQERIEQQRPFAYDAAARTKSADQLQDLLDELQGNLAMPRSTSQASIHDSQASMNEVDELLVELQTRTQKTLEDAQRYQEDMVQRASQLHQPDTKMYEGRPVNQWAAGLSLGSHPPDVNITTPPSQMYRPVGLVCLSTVWYRLGQVLSMCYACCACAGLRARHSHALVCALVSRMRWSARSPLARNPHPHLFRKQPTARNALRCQQADSLLLCAAE